MDLRGTRRARLATAALLCAIGCGGSDDEAEERFPSRDWSGVYSLRVLESSTDCLGADAPPPLGSLRLEVRQSIANDATVMLGPIVALSGRFDGDELEAVGEVTQPIALPDSLVSRAASTDSLETIVYRLEATFEGDSLRGRYAVRAPDLVALARGTEKRRCSYEYSLWGSTLGAMPSAAPPATEGRSAGSR